MADEEELAITHGGPEWCATDTGGVLLCLYLTSVRVAWIPRMIDIVRAAAARREDGRVAAISVVSLDKRYPLDIGFDSAVGRLREGIRELAPSIGASAFVLEVGGFLALPMKAAMTTLGRLAKSRYPKSIHPTVVSAASWIAPHVGPKEFRGVRHYVDAMHRMKEELGCEPPFGRT